MMTGQDRDNEDALDSIESSCPACSVQCSKAKLKQEQSKWSSPILCIPPVFNRKIVKSLEIIDLKKKFEIYLST